VGSGEIESASQRLALKRWATLGDWPCNSRDLLKIPFIFVIGNEQAKGKP
jgi:hypothetical protein